MIKVENILNKLFCAKAEKVLSLLNDNCIDLALVDPCYGIDYCGQLKRKLGGKRLSITKYNWKDYGAADKDWDKERTSPALIKEVIRVSKNQIIWGGNYFADILPASQGWLVWNKGQRAFSLADGELAWTSYDKALRIFDYSRSQYNADEPNKIHPTQKPVKLFIWCLEKAKLKPGAVVLDCFCGSGTTAIACEEKGYKYICLDEDPDMVAKAQNRLADYKRQGKLFNPEDVQTIQTRFLEVDE
ncbi:MAG: DNA methyltransferase [bacterium]|nr:DNA methyltransferase [bacterium]